MAAAFTIKVKCNICGTEKSITDTQEAAKTVPSGQKGYQCAKCGQRFNWRFSSIAATHSTSVASNATITLTVTDPGSVASAVS